MKDCYFTSLEGNVDDPFLCTLEEILVHVGKVNGSNQMNITYSNSGNISATMLDVNGNILGTISAVNNVISINNNDYPNNIAYIKLPKKNNILKFEAVNASGSETLNFSLNAVDIQYCNITVINISGIDFFLPDSKLEELPKSLVSFDGNYSFNLSGSMYDLLDNTNLTAFGASNSDIDELNIEAFTEAIYSRLGTFNMRIKKCTLNNVVYTKKPFKLKKTDSTVTVSSNGTELAYYNGTTWTYPS